MYVAIHVAISIASTLKAVWARLGPRLDQGKAGGLDRTLIGPDWVHRRYYTARMRWVSTYANR